MIKQALQYGDQRIRYEVNFVTGRDRKVAIHVLPDSVVRVDAPRGASLVEIKMAVAQRARWLSLHLEGIGRRMAAVSPREYISGESHLYLGRRYLLKVRNTTIELPYVSLRRGRFEIGSPQMDRTTISAMLRAWYRERARLVFSERLERLADGLTWLERAPTWKLVTMKRQWGSCSPRGLLSLNPHLVKAPSICVDYVILHELCHLQVHNHSKAFYRIMSNTMPEWKLVKHRLDHMADQLLTE